MTADETARNIMKTGDLDPVDRALYVSSAARKLWDAAFEEGKKVGINDAKKALWTLGKQNGE